MNKKFIHTIKKHKIKLSLCLAGVVCWLFCLPKPLFQNPTSTVVESREGVLMGARIAEDGQWRFPALDSVPYRFEQSILHFEDEYFYQHPGFNPVSISKALWGNLTTSTRRGGSTLTQQVIRLSRKNKQRNYAEKAIELVQATRLEVGYSKKEILNLYATHAPFGGNVVGLETAAWRYFGIPASELSWGQSAALAVLPNAPSLIFPGKNEAILKTKRNRLLLKLFQKNIIDKTTYELALEEALPGKPYPLPETALHLTEKIRKEHFGKRIQTTVDLNLQRTLNRIAKEHHFKLQQNEIHNLAVLVLDVETREILAYIGNAPTTVENNKFVDVIEKPRSTGSILKPFLYTALLDSGELLPNTLVADVPTVINGYVPENFNKEFNGVVPASIALSRSLNIPAVRMLRSYGLERFHRKLDELQLHGINRDPNHYGLSLILGGGESSLWEVTNAYAGMASTLNFFNKTSSEYRATDYKQPTYIFAEEKPSKKLANPTVFDAGAIYKTFEALQQINRPLGEENWSFFSNSQPIAWKTGTSFGFKDAWAVGVTKKYAIGVWVGNADGEGRPGLTGLQAAAPVLFDVLDVLPKSEWFATPFDELTEVSVCSKSGHLAGVFCGKTVSEYIPKNGVRTEPCPYHQQVFLSKSEQYRVNSSCYELAEMKQKSWFSLPPMLEYYYAPLHPEYKVLPPFRNGCLKEGEQLLEFIFPKKNETILLAKNFEEQTQDVIFKIAHRNPDTTVYWYLDGSFITTTETFHEISLQPLPGAYTLTAIDQDGNEIQERFMVERASS
ncbi:penicillin-binding protein 1C [Marinirhabdus gelatinilytica]|uniref:peptidoglycan glycosyltransferase n=1 Tax=Marinirhabdus gelatinilytica TaxID=1703343 RepID=A0A370QJU4_9FLAO|nr:penicillin-binding protein 1C [Marinirhabdus gelatinilytica]RDK88611.1 penicillin-binding protein 1C [Marinirhabdus gelatinilytica]